MGTSLSERDRRVWRQTDGALCSKTGGSPRFRTGQFDLSQESP
jgi:hypothetical protein